VTYVDATSGKDFLKALQLLDLVPAAAKKRILRRAPLLCRQINRVCRLHQQCVKEFPDTPNEFTDPRLVDYMTWLLTISRITQHPNPTKMFVR
jgi:hypothetical protein